MSLRERKMCQIMSMCWGRTLQSCVLVWWQSQQVRQSKASCIGGWHGLKFRIRIIWYWIVWESVPLQFLPIQDYGKSRTMLILTKLCGLSCGDVHSVVMYYLPFCKTFIAVATFIVWKCVICFLLLERPHVIHRFEMSHLVPSFGKTAFIVWKCVVWFLLLESWPIFSDCCFINSIYGIIYLVEL